MDPDDLTNLDGLMSDEPTLADLEAIVQRGLSTFVQVGQALIEIQRHPEWYRDYGGFDQYLHGRWGLGQSTGYQKIDGAKVYAGLRAGLLELEQKSSANAELLPLRESHTRALAPLLKLPDNSSLMAAVWTDAMKDGQPTEAALRAKVKTLLPPKKGKRDPDLEVCATCHGRGRVKCEKCGGKGKWKRAKQPWPGPAA